MLSLLPPGSMDPPPPHLPRLALSASAASTAPPSPSQSADGGGTRKRKFEPLAATSGPTGALSSLSATAAGSSWAGDVPLLSSTALLLSAAVRSSTASTASSTPSPRPHSALSLPGSGSSQPYESVEAAPTISIASPASSQPSLQLYPRPTSQPLPPTLTSIFSTSSSIAAEAAPLYSPPDAITPAAYPASAQPPAVGLPLQWSIPSPSTVLSSSSIQTPRYPTSTPTSAYSSPRSSVSAHHSFALPLPPPPPPPPGVPPSSITTLMPVMPYSRIEPSIDQHFTVVDGDTLLGRYRVVRLLGRGTFSQVVQCRDMQAEEQCQVEEDATRVAASGKRSTDVAIKIVRAVERYRVAAEREARLLQSIDHTRRTMSTAANSRQSWQYATDGSITLLGSFMLAGHLCLVFPVLGLSLYDFLRLNRFRPLFPAHIRHIGYQLLQTCAFLHDECGIIHADIKVSGADATASHVSCVLPFVPTRTCDCSHRRLSVLCVVVLCCVARECAAGRLVVPDYPHCRHGHQRATQHHSAPHRLRHRCPALVRPPSPRSQPLLSQHRSRTGSGLGRGRRRLGSGLCTDGTVHGAAAVQHWTGRGRRAHTIDAAAAGCGAGQCVGAATHISAVVAAQWNE